MPSKFLGIARGELVPLSLPATIVALALFSVATLHFVFPAPFVRIVPTVLPAKEALVLVSGIAEATIAFGLLLRSSRKPACYALILLLLAVFPANINMAVNNIQLSDTGSFPRWAMFARLPLQGVFLWIAWRIARADQ